MAKRLGTTEARPFVEDLRALHWYARSHMPGQKLTMHALTSAMDKHEIGLSVDAFGAALTRLEQEYDVILMERRPIRGERGREVDPDPTIPDHLDHPEDWVAYKSPEYSSRRKSRLTLDGAIFAEVATLLAAYEFIAMAGTARSGAAENGAKARPDTADRNAVLGWLRLERRRVQNIVDAIRSPSGSVFHLRAQDQDAGLLGEPMDARIMEFAPPRPVEYLEDPESN